MRTHITTHAHAHTLYDRAHCLGANATYPTDGQLAALVTQCVDESVASNLYANLTDPWTSDPYWNRDSLTRALAPGFLGMVAFSFSTQYLLLWVKAIVLECSRIDCKEFF